jgi:hypothetical protein
MNCPALLSESTTPAQWIRRKYPGNKKAGKAQGVKKGGCRLFRKTIYTDQDNAPFIRHMLAFFLPFA